MENYNYLTILLCTYNRAKILKPLIEALIKQVEKQNRNDLEVLVIDNNSTDQTRSITTSLQNTCNFLHYAFEGKQGLAKARNTGIKLAGGKVIAFIDDDIILDENWLNEILVCLSKYSYKAFGGKIIPLWEKEKPKYINLHGPFLLSQKIFPSHDNGDLEKFYPINKEETNPIGANMWIYKELFTKYGNFREDLGRVGYGGIPCEDTEFCSRLLRAKETILYYPKAFVYHPVSTYRMSKEFIRSWHYKNGISSVRKGGRSLLFLDLFRFLIRAFIYIPFFVFLFIIGNILFIKSISCFFEFKLIRVMGQLREFLRIWLKLPLKDPVF